MYFWNSANSHDEMLIIVCCGESDAIGSLEDFFWIGTGEGSSS